MNITLRAFAQMQSPGVLAVLLIALLHVSPAQADMTADIERILEIDQQKQELRKQMRNNEITRAEKRKREQALKEEVRQINRSYGKRGNKQRQEWDKQVRAARKERNEAELQARKAAREAREEEAAQARAERRKAEAEKAEAAKQEAYQATLANASRFSQVHLPEEVVVPMATTDVQGIEFGMSKQEAERLMKEQGYTAGSSGSINDDQSTRTLALFYHTYELPEMKGTRVKALQYKQRFKPETRFDSEAIADQIRQKYGPPTWESNGPAGVKLGYQIEQPDYNIEAACNDEMERRGTLPEKPYPPLAGPTSGKVWLERGERDVKARCPDQLQIFRHLIHAGLGLSGTIHIDPRMKQISIIWEDNGWQSRGWRRRNEAQLVKSDSGGKAAVDL